MPREGGILLGVNGNVHPTFNEIDQSTFDLTRTENLQWCHCGGCIVMPDAVECQCCHEFRDVLGDKLDGQFIVDYEDFKLLRHRQYKYVTYAYGIRDMSNKKYRFMAYSQFTAWIEYHSQLCFDKYQFEERVILPSCAVNAIRSAYPS